MIGGMTIPLSQVKEAKIPLKPVSAAAVLAPGMAVEMNIPVQHLAQLRRADQFSRASVFHRRARNDSLPRVE